MSPAVETPPGVRLTPAQSRVLAAGRELHGALGRPASLAELADHLGVTRPAVGAHVRAVVAAGVDFPRLRSGRPAGGPYRTRGGRGPGHDSRPPAGAARDPGLVATLLGPAQGSRPAAAEPPDACARYLAEWRKLRHRRRCAGARGHRAQPAPPAPRAGKGVSG